MIESMACGTPVIATRWGAVPEVIDEVVPGSSSTTTARWRAALPRADELDPGERRRAVEGDPPRSAWWPTTRPPTKR